MTTKGYVVGIDLGTTNSSLAYVDAQGHPVTLLNREGSPLTPSAVYIRRDGAVQAGAEALAASRLTPERVARQFKRFIAEKYYPRLVGKRQLSPQWLSAVVLKRLAEDFRNQIGPIAGAVITVPAYFGDTRRKATIDAGELAGLNVIDIINEPTAAALAGAYLDYLNRTGSVDRPSQEEITAVAKTTLVFDLGGGTFDVTVIRIENAKFTVLATGGEVRLGGMDWDARLTDCVANEFCRRTGLDPRDDPAVIEMVYLNCEAAKRALTDEEETTVAVTHMGKNLTLTLSRKFLEETTRDLITRTELSTELVLEEPSLGWNDVDEILLVGGASRMPMVRTMLRRISGLEPCYATQPDQIVAHGAAIHAVMCRPQCALVPCDTTLSPDDTGIAITIESPSTGGGPERVTRAADTERIPSVKLINVNSHSLGVAALRPDTGEVINSRLLTKNTPLPTEHRKVFGTQKPDQRTVRVRVVEGEAQEANACTQIGECVISSLPAGLPQGSPIEVTFVYKTNGRLHVRAVEKTSGSQAECYIERDGRPEMEQAPRTYEEVSGMAIL